MKIVSKQCSETFVSLTNDIEVASSNKGTR